MFWGWYTYEVAWLSLPVYFLFFFPDDLSNSGGCLPNLNQLRGCFGFECFFWPFVDCVVLFVFLLWGKHVALFDPIDPESRCFTWCNQALVHCDFPPQNTHKYLVDEMYDEFKGHWTDVLFYIILWWCSQGLTNHNPGIRRGLIQRFGANYRDLSLRRNPPQIPLIQVEELQQFAQKAWYENRETTCSWEPSVVMKPFCKVRWVMPNMATRRLVFIIISPCQ